MIRALLVAVPLAVLLACGGSGGGTTEDPDRLGCSPDQETWLPVQVIDVNGDPVGGAEITAKNITTGKIVIATTNADGRTTALGQSLGSGTIQVSATFGSKSSGVRQATFVCGECTCTFDPTSITLQLNP